MAEPTDTAASSERLVRAFLSSWEQRDLDVICASFAQHAVYHNVPVKPIEGIAGIRAIFQAFLDAFVSARLEIVTLAAGPGLVIAERVDRFVMNGGRRIDLPVTGVFVVEHGKIVRFSDYFDLGDFERQSGMKL